jgi:NAD-dependent SIR2 family protein deacetylase
LILVGFNLKLSLKFDYIKLNCIHLDTIQFTMKTIAEAILNADAIIILTGAGMGVDSGLATFRGPTAKGWTHSQTGEDIDYYDICQGTYFDQKDHAMRGEAMAFWQSCHQSYNSADPHEGYHLIMKWVKERPYFVYTTNVDHHWARVGVPENQLYEIHGSVANLQCARPHNRLCLDLTPWNVTENVGNCLNCKQPLRPNILMFNDGGYVDEHQSLVKKAYQKFIKDHHRKRVAIISIGAGQAVPTIKYEINMLESKLPHSTVIRINPDVLPGEYSIAKGALNALKEIDVLLATNKVN